jgi:hypothetical protein
MSEFDRLPKDVLIETVSKFSLNDIYTFCDTYPQYRNIICNNDTFWRIKIKNDYNVDYDGIYPLYRYVYNNVRSWSILLEGVKNNDRLCV